MIMWGRTGWGQWQFGWEAMVLLARGTCRQSVGPFAYGQLLQITCCLQKMDFYCGLPLAFLHIAHMSVLLFLLLISSQRHQVGLPFTAWMMQRPPVHHPKNPIMGFPPRDSFFGQSPPFFSPSFAFFWFLLLFSQLTFVFFWPFLAIYFFLTTPDPKFFKKTPTYPPTYVQDQVATKPT